MCKEGLEYEVIPFTQSSDRVCKPYTQCSGLEYVLRMGDSKHDNLCAVRTDCSLSQNLYYERIPSVDSTDPDVNGTDSVCSMYTRCPVGQYANFTGDRTHDRQCSKCSPGSYGPDGQHCLPCPPNTYAPYFGMEECLGCNECKEPNGLVCPLGEDCSMAFKSLCGPVDPGVCMQCPTRSWMLDPSSRLCTACAPGFFYDTASFPEPSCVQCPRNSYCPSRDRMEVCQGLMVFSRSVLLPNDLFLHHVFEVHRFF